MYNAIRKPEEIQPTYGVYRYLPLKPVAFYCKIKDDHEAMFRPAFYTIENYESINTSVELRKKQIPKRVVSMIGCYRNVAKNGEKIKVSGMLEQVKNVETGEIFHQVVVGTGVYEEEYIWPM
jgi:predicted nucleotidyltransferase